MMLCLKLTYFILIYLIPNSKWILVESAETSPSTPPAATNEGQESTNPSEPAFKFFKKDPNDANKTVELESINYDSKKIGGNRTDYDFKDNVQCTLITLDGKDFWKHGEHKCNENLKSVSYRAGPTIVIHLGNGFIQYIKDNNNEWKVEFTNNLKTSGDGENGTETGGGDGGGTPLSGGGGGGTGTGGRGTGLGGGGTGTGGGDGGTGTGTDGSGTGTGTRSGGGDSTHTSGGGTGTGGSSETGGGSTPLSRDGTGTGGSTVGTDQDSTSTTPAAGTIESGTKTGVEICIKNNKKATPQFDYKKDGNTVTYTTKGENGFKLVKQNNTEIWKANDQSEYATKVVLEGKGKKDKKVTIYLPNNIKKVFKRDDKNKPWSEVTQESSQTTGQPASGTTASGTTEKTSGGCTHTTGGSADGSQGTTPTRWSQSN